MSSTQQPEESSIHLPPSVYVWTVENTLEWLRQRRPRIEHKYRNLFIKHQITGGFIVFFTLCAIEAWKVEKGFYCML